MQGSALPREEAWKRAGMTWKRRDYLYGWDGAEDLPGDAMDTYR